MNKCDRKTRHYEIVRSFLLPEFQTMELGKIERVLRGIENRLTRYNELACERDLTDREKITLNKLERKFLSMFGYPYASAEYDPRGHSYFRPDTIICRETYVEPRGYAFINHDPRGYALKLKLREYIPGIHTDFGGYGIVAPDPKCFSSVPISNSITKKYMHCG